MIESAITKIGLALGLVLAVVYVLRCRRLKRTPDLSIACVCVLTGVGSIVGPILILSAFTDTFKAIEPRPEHLGLAGLAIIWVSWQFVHRICLHADDAAPPTSPRNDGGAAEDSKLVKADPDEDEPS